MHRVWAPGGGGVVGNWIEAVSNQRSAVGNRRLPSSTDCRVLIAVSAGCRMLVADCCRWWRASIPALVVALAAAAGPAPPPPPPAPAGPAYLFYYHDAAGVHRLDARSGADSLLFSIAPPRVARAASPGRAKLSIGHRGPAPSRLRVVDVATGAVRRLHAAGRTYRYTLAWSRDGTRLAVGYFTERRVGRETLPGAGDIVIASGGGGRALHPVAARGCRGDASMRLQGQRDVTFSPDSRRLFYLATGQARRGQRTVAATELHVARYDGSGARRVVSDPYDPQRARWSP